MAGSPTSVIVIAQAANGDALQQGVVVHDGEVAGEAVPGETHAATEAHDDVFPPFDPSGFGNQLLWLALTFAALYIIMSRVALPRIGGILETRRNRIEGDLREAERLRLETEKAAAAYEAALAEARQNAHAIAEETRASIRLDIDNKRSNVESDLARRVAEAEARIQATKLDALGSVGSIAAETAQELVGRLAGTVTPKQARDAVAFVSKE